MHNPDNKALARSAGSDLFGKVDDALPEVRVNGDVREAVRRKAASVGMNETEFLRNLVYVNLYGIDHVLSLQAERLKSTMVNAGQLLGTGVRQ